MIPKAITAPFRWWAKHPWIVFQGTILFFIGIVLFLSAAPHPPSVFFVLRTIVLPVYIVSILSFIRGMFLMMWKRSKGDAIAVIALVVVLAAMMWLAVEMISARERFGYYSEVELELLRAAIVQERYFAKNHSFKSCVACTSNDLPELYNFPNVTLNIETASTSFTLIATHARCDDDQWTLQSTPGEINWKQGLTELRKLIHGPSRTDACK